MKGALAFSAALFLAVPVYAEPVQLKFGYPGPLTAWPYTKGFGPWAQEVERDAPGLVEIKVYPGGAIATFRNAYDRTINGVADMTFGTFGDTPGQACAAIDRHSGAALSLRMGKAADEINVEGKAKFIAMGGLGRPSPCVAQQALRDGDKHIPYSRILKQPTQNKEKND